MKQSKMTPCTAFVPDSYYALWLTRHKIDAKSHPYTRALFDESIKKVVPFSVSEFDLHRTPGGSTVSLAIVKYRSHHSAAEFTETFFF